MCAPAKQACIYAAAIQRVLHQSQRSPTRDDRFALLLQACRPLAELGAVDGALYVRAREGVDGLVAQLRGRSVPAAAGCGRRREGGGAVAALPPTAEAAGGEKALEQCRGCWGFGHRKNSSKCPRVGQDPLAKPVDAARAPAVTVVRRRKETSPALVDDDEAEAEEEDEAEEDDEHENVCHGCGETGMLHCCSTCRHVYCGDCLTMSSLAAVSNADWRCPICTGISGGRAVGNPQTGRAQACGKFRARKRGVAELGPSACRAAKRALRAQDKAKGAKKSRGRVLYAPLACATGPPAADGACGGPSATAAKSILTARHLPATVRDSHSATPRPALPSFSARVVG